ncbi:DNA segregation ATPase FtsK/SpoIIIE, S-DNA-T family [Lachnospiraceae bacterium KHCPX20]|nr:DNA segregation ATPase FtsK/SpoIIIE, S-DNA-T family [Lachnospiraceae bacterium KHCPX20]
MSKKKNTSSKQRGSIPKSEVEKDLLLWGMLAVCVLLFLSNLGLGGVVGHAVASLGFGMFGLLTYVVPVGLLIGTFFGVSNAGNRIAAVKLVASAFAVIFLCELIALITQGADPVAPLEVYRRSSLHHTGGGLLGGLFAYLMTMAFGVTFSYILTLILFMVCMVLITEKGLLQRFSKVADRKAREGTKRLKERYQENEANREQRREEKRLLRMDKKVSGVASDTEIIPAKTGKRRHGDELHRLTAPEEKEPEGALHPGNEKEDDLPDVVVERVSLSSGEEVKTKIHIMDEPAEEPEKEVVAEPVINPYEPASSYEPATTYEPESSYEPATSYEQASSYEPETSYEQESSYEPAPSFASEPESVSSPDEVQEVLPVQPKVYEEPYEEVQPVVDTKDAPVSSPKPVASSGQPKSQAQAKEPLRAEEVEPEVDTKDYSNYCFPPTTLLTEVKKKGNGNSRLELESTAEKLATTLKNFGVNVTITEVSCGPAVTRYEMQPEMGVKVSKIVNLADDIKLNLAAEDIRIEAPIPGKAAVGIEVPNKEVVMVPFRDMMESKEFKESKSKIGFAAGRDIGGNVILSDIAKMPHLLIAGATGSGKSVCINTIIMSILFKAKPDEVKFVMIDPKVVELSVYNGIPHLLIPVVTDPKKAAGALNWAVREMDERYKKFANTGVRDMKGYNARIHNGMMTVDDHGQSVEIAAEKMPQIVVIVDELADLMMTAPKDVEGAICRLAQLARAAGIHLIIATQRPSVNVITGLIKANMPSRIAFSVTSGIDSRTILDMNGAEKLLGKGDMLYYPQGFTKPVRVQGAFVPDDDVINVVDFIKRENGGAAEYDMSIQDTIDSDDSSATAIDGGEGGFDSERDSYFADAGRLVIDKEKGSIGMLQRNFKVGFNRAARIMDQLEEFGVVGPEEGTKPRRVLLTKEQFEELLSQ